MEGRIFYHDWRELAEVRSILLRDECFECWKLDD